MDEQGGSVPDCPALLTTFARFYGAGHLGRSVLAHWSTGASMRGHGHGGSLLVVPAGSEAWRESIVHPIIVLGCARVFGLADLMRQDLGLGIRATGTVQCERPSIPWPASRLSTVRL